MTGPATHKIDLGWKEGYSVSLSMVNEWMHENIGEPYCGPQASPVGLELWFTSEPSEQQRQDIASYWAGLDEESDEAVGYKSAATLAAEKEAAAASGRAKLAQLGLSETEIAALLG